MGPKAEPTEPATALWQANVLPAYTCRAVPPAGDFVPRKMRWNLGVSGVNRKIRCLEEAQGEAKEAAYTRKRGRIPTKLHEFACNVVVTPISSGLSPGSCGLDVKARGWKSGATLWRLGRRKEATRLNQLTPQRSSFFVFLSCSKPTFVGFPFWSTFSKEPERLTCYFEVLCASEAYFLGPCLWQKVQVVWLLWAFLSASEVMKRQILMCYLLGLAPTPKFEEWRYPPKQTVRAFCRKVALRSRISA